MPERTEFATGEFSWTDLTTTDTDAASTFYTTVFGWVAEPVPMPDAGGYTMFTLNGRHVAGLSPKMDGDPGPNRWTVYVNVDDLDKTVEVAQSSGATVLLPGMDVFTSGRMAILADPAGAAVALWQPQEHKGAGVSDEPGALTWTELTTSDVDGAKTFYSDVFGWGAETSDGGGMQYTEFKLGDRSVAGLMAKPADMPAEVPSFWMPYFQSTDPDKTAGEATALGGTLIAGPMDIPGGGRFAVLSDPQGSMFGLYRPGEH
jgi:predicted enzyme related to lactoylglutathione lyase